MCFRQPRWWSVRCHLRKTLLSVVRQAIASRIRKRFSLIRIQPRALHAASAKFPEDAKRSPVAASIVLAAGDLWYSLFLASSLNNPETGGRRLKQALYGYLSKASTRAMPLQSSSAYLEALRNSAVAHSASGMCRSGCSEAHVMAISISLSMRPRVKTGA